ncbi:MAG: hypothetical protein ACP5E4_03495 [Candidatus Aenigmatarchaeota archaeon]
MTNVASQMPGLIIPAKTNWDSIPNPDDLTKWGWAKEELAQKLFGVPARDANGTFIMDSQGKHSRTTFLSELEFGTTIGEMASYAFAIPMGYVLPPISESIFDLDNTSAVSKRASIESLLNVPERGLDNYVLARAFSLTEKDSEAEVMERVKKIIGDEKAKWYQQLSKEGYVRKDELERLGYIPKNQILSYGYVPVDSVPHLRKFLKEQGYADKS